MKPAVTQMAGTAPSVATVLTRWIRQTRLTQVQIAAAGRITRSYVSAIARGKVPRPGPETLRRLARGLATDPDTETLDVLKYEQALRELSEAAGIADLVYEPDRGALVRDIRSLGSNVQAADFWRALIEAHPNPSPSLQQMLRWAGDSYDRPGGEDLRGLLLLLLSSVPPDLETVLRQIKLGPEQLPS